ncbi:SEFIR domain-containing protein [Amycolatopsis sp., V23-08]|uniref:SEFIR domain-containing protein n=1 Tax=Amycolatopsis heterodermiae TaxID=3110235 RepID=A0ABU5RLJ1_9PSEU|nr:SEFIR domain-containing protein [Amycolatopsis sp., V23-08]MEA5367053.1 SEFIR domain-containing protein [Amycolatopsis sp., V23-08]
MTDREAPRVFVTYSHDTPEHKELVRRFATFLRGVIGLDVHVDTWYDNVRRDWSLWAVEQLNEADFILVVASPDYKRRADGEAAADEGRGAQFETAIIRNNLTRDLRKETERVLPVILPGRSVEEIPSFLNGYSTTRYHVDEFTREGISDLLSAITGHGQYSMPRRGEWLGGSQEPKQVPAGELPWLASSAGIRRGSAVIDGIRYEDSIVLRPTARATGPGGYVEMDLGGLYQRLTAVVGVLDDAADPFQVGHFQVFLDGAPKSEHQVARGKPATIDLDVTGALRLRLEMARPGVTASPFGGAAVQVRPRAGRPPELAWGDPTMT